MAPTTTRSVIFRHGIPDHIYCQCRLVMDPQVYTAIVSSFNSSMNAPSFNSIFYGPYWFYSNHQRLASWKEVFRYISFEYWRLTHLSIEGTEDNAVQALRYVRVLA